MRKYVVGKRILLSGLTLWLVHALVTSGDCKKTDGAEDVPQAGALQNLEQVAASETVDNAGVSEKSDLRILYVGLPDTERQKDFVTFLGKHFNGLLAWIVLITSSLGGSIHAISLIQAFIELELINRLQGVPWIKQLKPFVGGH